jgi:2,5-diketo-D-gluconate reductase A
MNTVPAIKLNNGIMIPQLGFGTYQVTPQETVSVVSQALEIGYRHIDTAEMYGNEKEVGKAVKDSGIARSEIFITSKLNNGFHNPEDARKAFDASLADLASDYVDLFLIHWPLPTLYDGGFVSTWKVLEEFLKEGRAKSIGVSNFQKHHLEELIEQSDIIPAVNQIELHPYLTNTELAEFGKAHNIATEAWSPIAQGGVLKDVVIADIAENVNRTSAQVVLRWHIQHGYIVFPKSSTPERIKENFALFDFELTDQQMKQIDGLDKDEAGRTGPNPDTFDYIPS